MLEEQRQSATDATTNARFHRRMAYFTALIVLLTFFWTVAIDLEEQFRADDENIHPDPSEIVQMQQAFETMSTQLEALQEAEENEAEREAAADSEMAELMRGIAVILREQTDDDSRDVEVESPH
jgi:recombinational DNA repair protein RecT